MYSNRFICVVKVDGKILREQSNLVTLPFGSEYTILLKNLNSRRAMVKVSVDGKDATEGTRLIIAPNATLELERFIRNGNLDAGNRFKFIERTGAVEAHRGITENDGLIRAEFWAEKEKQETVETIIRRHYIDDYEPWYPKWPRPRPWWDDGIRFTSSQGRRREIRASASAGLRQHTPMRAMRKSVDASMELNDSGITVPGSESHQQFYNASGFPLESNSHVIVLQLRGEIGGKQVIAPVTVSAKPQCSTCGRTNKAGMRFCGQCGTALEII